MSSTLDLPTITVLTSACGRCGIDLKPVLGDLDITTTAESAPLGALTLDQFARLMGALHSKTRQGHFPFAFAEVFHFDGQPAITAYLVSAHRLRDVGPLLEWIPDLIHPAIRFDGVDDGQRATVDVHLIDSIKTQRSYPLLIELILAVVARMIQRIAPAMQIIDSVQFAHNLQTDLEAYQHCFGCPVHFDSDANRLILNSQTLDAALPGSLPAAHAQAEQTIRLKLVGDGVEPPLALQIDETLRADWGLFESGINGLAKALKMHPRTLQRRLRERGLRYSDLLASTRHDLACQMLRETELDIDSIGFKLGFKERRSFTQAFGQWQDQTPTSYRLHTRVTRGQDSLPK